MKCPKCGSINCKIETNTVTKGKDYSICKGVMGAIAFGTLGTLCGWSNTRSHEAYAYWVCRKCGYKFKG